jgi:hypothetical protein
VKTSTGKHLDGIESVGASNKMKMFEEKVSREKVVLLFLFCSFQGA